VLWRTHLQRTEPTCKGRWCAPTCKGRCCGVLPLAKDGAVLLRIHLQTV
jgi:hypothetical protein